jgi:hypothetical protein
VPMNRIGRRMFAVTGLVALVGSAAIAREWAVALGIGAMLMAAGWHRTDKAAMALGAGVALAGGFGACVAHPSFDSAAGLVVLGLAMAEITARTLFSTETDPTGICEVPWFLPSILLGTSYLVLTSFGSAGLSDSSGGASPARIGAVAIIGVVLIGLAVIREHAVGLWCGVALVVTALLVAFGGQLRTLPVWIWVMVGGAALIGTAAMVELKRRNGDPTSGRLDG